jgi:hypothetical protein
MLPLRPTITRDDVERFRRRALECRAMTEIEFDPARRREHEENALAYELHGGTGRALRRWVTGRPSTERPLSNSQIALSAAEPGTDDGGSTGADRAELPSFPASHRLPSGHSWEVGFG